MGCSALGGSMDSWSVVTSGETRAQMPVDGQTRWETTVKSFLLIFQYCQGGKKQACNTLNDF